MKTLYVGHYLLISRTTIAGAFIFRWEKIRLKPGLFNRLAESLHFLKSVDSIIATSVLPDHFGSYSTNAVGVRGCPFRDWLPAPIRAASKPLISRHRVSSTQQK